MLEPDMGQLDILDPIGAEADPVMVGHALDENLFGKGGGLVFADEVVEQSAEVLLVFAGDEAGAGGEAPGKAVAGRFGFAFVGLGTGGFLRVGLVGCDLSLRGSHNG